MKLSDFFLPSILILPMLISAQEKKAGPVLKEYGKVWKIENPDFATDTTMEYKVVFDVMNSPKSPTALNRSIETAARFLNMHAQSGVPESQLKVALVIHGKAAKDVITNQAYQARFGSPNPNHDMINQLMDSGVEIILCGQSSKSRDYPKEDLISGVQISLSAMTALIQLQNKGYQLIKF
ncbi:DsrE family protein [Flagellimonas meridianipacifica]|uniref:Intracellular sulfur oxidation DsrE/DsrF family protein n=1 Tax=Flagellimonas meridianipacifica TaxID=1080225 RepID=A0A2T0MBE4_9FLAO|nr:DsrE family protein [Allomuricauda pacifica]PRX54732.1 intracellular sulfur oxidation DsrE/DsrF family protein [Allomuricauda pacifica]